jgi:cytochrome oxidase Cu insertion factor (SCO1/SenC/PrrC family)
MSTPSTPNVASSPPSRARAGAGARRTALWLVALLVVAAAGSLWMSASSRRSTKELPVIATVPDFSLTEASGRTVTRQDLAGAPWVADLIFTHCGGICPTMSAEMARLSQSSSDLPARFVSISVDPERDTPEALEAYAQRFGADRTRWLFLRGDIGAVKKLATDGFLVPVGEGDTSQTGDEIIHSQRFVLIDANSRVRGTYDVRDREAMLALRGDLRRVSEEERAG